MNQSELWLAYSADHRKVELPGFEIAVLPYATRYTPTAQDAEGLIAFAKLPSDHEQSCVNPSSEEACHRHDRNDFLGEAEIDGYGGVSPHFGGRLPLQAAQLTWRRRH